MENNGFIKLYRVDKAYELMKGHPMAFILLTVIALRARRQDGIYLKAGQALIGDFETYGMSRRQYRTAINHLKNGQLAAFKTTSKGTIATLIDYSIYDVNADVERPTKRPAKSENTYQQRPSGDQQEATNNKERMKEQEYKNTSSKNNFKSKNHFSNRTMNYDPAQYTGCIEL
jgi:hypothetical protein